MADSQASVRPRSLKSETLFWGFIGFRVDRALGFEVLQVLGVSGFRVDRGFRVQRLGFRVLGSSV